MTLIPVFLGLACCFGYAAFLVRLAWAGARDVPGDSAGDSALWVTVVIPARNEELSIEQCLEAVLRSADARCDIVVVDDASTDRTANVVEGVIARVGSERVRLVRLNEAPQETRAHKKRAVTAGIAAARGDLILQTDADCTPGPRWVPSMRSCFGASTGFVAGPVVYAPDAGLFAGFQALEYVGFMGIAAGAIALGRPILCSGANIAFRKETFREVGGHAGLEHLSSGDDELFMQKVASDGRWGVRFQGDRDAVVETAPETSLAGFMRQRQRWASKGGHYPDRRIVALNVMIFLAIVFVAVAVPASVFVESLRVPALAGLGLKMAGEAVMLASAARRFGRTRLLKWFLVSQPLQVVYLVVAVILGAAGGFIWKERRLER